MGAKVPWKKVLGLFAPRERMFHGTKVPRERKFSLWTFRPGNESAEERKGQIPPVRYWRISVPQPLVIGIL